MEKHLAPLIQVRLDWATHHAWKARQTLQSAAPATALWLVMEGEVEVTQIGERKTGAAPGEHTWKLKAGDAFLWSAASSRRILTSGGAAWLSLGMQVNFFAHLDLHRVLNLPLQWRPSPGEWQTLLCCTRELVGQWHNGRELVVDAACIAAYGREMDAQAERRAPIDVMIADSLARVIFGLCWRHLANDETSAAIERRIPPWLSKTLQRVHDEPTIKVASLSRAAGFSPAQFRRSFHAHVGVTPREYVLQNRLDVARELLKDHALTVSAVAAQCGFSSLSHFIHIFKQANGLSPSRYRQAARHPRI